MDAARNSHELRPATPFMPKRFFITGTDTGIGKTLVSALLCAALDAIYWKPIQTGTREGTDTATVMQLAQLPRHERCRKVITSSLRFRLIWPRKWAGVRIELRKIKMPARSAR